MNLYELKDGYFNLQNLLLTGEIDEETFNDTIADINDSIEVKAENYAKIIRMIDGNISTVKAEIDRLSEIKKQLDNNKDKLKNNLEEVMIATGNVKFKTDLFSFNIQKNPPSVNVVDETLLTAYKDIWKVQEPILDKKLILEKLKAGETILGAEIKQTEGLRIR